MKKFGPAPLRKFDAEKIVATQGSDNLQAFVLALAVVFNDLKGLLIFRQTIAPLKPPDNEVSPHAGEWRGLEIQLDRYTMALIHELLVLVQEFADEAQGKQITNWMSKAPASVRKRWWNIVKVATAGKADNDATFAKVLLQIRNSLSSHYYQPKTLVGGFRAHFFEAPKSPMNKTAFASLGKNMEETRFYYADAALQAAIAKVTGAVGQKAFAKRLRKLGRDVNEALAHLLEEALKEGGEK